MARPSAAPPRAGTFWALLTAWQALRTTVSVGAFSEIGVLVGLGVDSRLAFDCFLGNTNVGDRAF